MCKEIGVAAWVDSWGICGFEILDLVSKYGEYDEGRKDEKGFGDEVFGLL